MAANRPSEEAARLAEAHFVERALQGIPDGWRIPLLLFYRDGVSVGEIAWRLDTTCQDVSARLSRGREMFCEYAEGRIASALKQAGFDNDNESGSEVSH